MNEMFCPKCSQQQISDDVRFCSRCGFQLHIVSQLLETNGALAEIEPKKLGKPPLVAQILSSAGAKVVFLSVVIAIFLFFIALLTDAPQILILPFFLFVIGVAMTIYKILFGNVPGVLHPDLGSPKILSSNESANKLPPMQSIPVNAYESPRRHTAEMTPPPSVTEPTTKLLETDAKTKDL